MKTPPAFFDFTRPTHSVKIHNIPEHVHGQEVVALFRTLIGGIRCVHDTKENFHGQMEISFHSPDAATKALCMNGYTVGGVALVVSPSKPESAAPRPKTNIDERRNLYVLGLPFALTKNEFTVIFSRFGTVSHSVILATIDNSSRRRGFVVMSSHEEARRALTALTRTQIKGHTIDVSWAVVQRSEGFLDGGDRAVLLEPRSSHLPSSGQHDRHPYPPPSLDSSGYSQSFHELESNTTRHTPLPTPTLIIMNLPTLLFSQVQDLNPLLYPFGRIEKLEITQVPNSDTISAVVQYASADIALEAKNALHGQYYGAYQIEARFKESTAYVNDARGLDLNAPFNPMNVLAMASAYASRAHSPSSVGSVSSFGYNGTMCQIGNYATCGYFNEPGFSPSATPPSPFSFAFKEQNVVRSGSGYTRWKTGSPKNQPFFSHFAPPHRMHFNANSIYQHSAT